MHLTFVLYVCFKSLHHENDHKFFSWRLRTTTNLLSIRNSSIQLITSELCLWIVIDILRKAHCKGIRDGESTASHNKFLYWLIVLCLQDRKYSQQLRTVPKPNSPQGLQVHQSPQSKDHPAAIKKLEQHWLSRCQCRKHMHFIATLQTSFCLKSFPQKIEFGGWQQGHRKQLLQTFQIIKGKLQLRYKVLDCPFILVSLGEEKLRLIT